MRLHMRSQATGLRKRHATCLAGIRLLPRMCPNVCSSLAGGFERLVTRLTDVRPLPRMCPHVNSQGLKL